MRRGRLWRRKRQRQISELYRKRDGGMKDWRIEVGVFKWTEKELEETLTLVADVVYQHAFDHGLPTPFVGASLLSAPAIMALEEDE